MPKEGGLFGAAMVAAVSLHNNEGGRAKNENHVRRLACVPT